MTELAKFIPNSKIRRILILGMLGWILIFFYEAFRQVVHLSLIPKGGRIPDPGAFDRVQIEVQKPIIEFESRHWTSKNKTFEKGIKKSLGMNSSQLGDFDIAIDHIDSLANVCSHISRPARTPDLVYDTWHLLNTTTHRIYVYSAFYDDRLENGMFPSLRLLAVGRPVESTVYCLVWYPGFDSPVPTIAKVSKNGGGHTFHRVKYDQLYLTCKLQTSYPLPTHVSLTSNKCDIPTNFIPLYIPIRTPPTHEFGVCVPVSFGTLDAYRIVEWIQALKLFGVTEITIYHVNMAKESLDLLHHFEEEGIVQLHAIPSVPFYMETRSGNKIGSPISLNDCMYRNMYRYLWALVIDFDELIVPRIKDNYHDMMKDIDKSLKLKQPARSYSFRNTYFWHGCPQEFSHDTDDTDGRSIIFKAVLSEAPSKFLYAAKSMIDPRRCISVFNHYCYHSFPVDKNTEYWTVDVNSTIARSHHYRELYKGKDKCKELKIQDQSMSRFKDILEPKVREKQMSLGLL